LSRVLVLDAEALSSLARQRGQRAREVRAAIEAARRLRREVVTPAVILAELYRGPGHNQVVDACLSRETGIFVRDTDRELARLVGGVLTAARADSTALADAHAVAAAVEAGGGVVVTGDESDIERLAATYPNVHVSTI
jgi:predicted nucleic acid-binding protein